MEQQCKLKADIPCKIILLDVEAGVYTSSTASPDSVMWITITMSTMRIWLASGFGCCSRRPGVGHHDCCLREAGRDFS